MISSECEFALCQGGFTKGSFAYGSSVDPPYDREHDPEDNSRHRNMARSGRRTPGMTVMTELTVPGLPAKQARSRVTRDRLLAAGRQLLDRGAFEATSIADIASAAGCSVGAFYHRFADKEAFFAALI